MTKKVLYCRVGKKIRGPFPKIRKRLSKSLPDLFCVKVSAEKDYCKAAEAYVSKYRRAKPKEGFPCYRCRGTFVWRRYKMPRNALPSSHHLGSSHANPQWYGSTHFTPFPQECTQETEPAALRVSRGVVCLMPGANRNHLQRKTHPLIHYGLMRRHLTAAPRRSQGGEIERCSSEMELYVSGSAIN